MLYYKLSAIINFISSTFVCIVAISNCPKSKINKAFISFSSTIAIWSFFYFFWLNSKSYQSALAYSRTLTAASIFIPVTFSHFGLCLLNKVKTYKTLLISAYLLSLALFMSCFTRLIVIDVKPQLIFPYWPTAGKAYIAYITLYFSLPGWTLLKLYSHYIKLSDYRHNQIRLVFLGIIISTLGGATNFFLWYNIQIPPIGNILVSFYPFLFLYSIIKYQLMDIKIVIKKSIVYSIAIASISIIYLLIVFTLEKLTQGILGYKSNLTSILTAFVLGILFIPQRQAIQTLVDRYFFMGTNTEIAEQNKKLINKISESEKYRTLSTLASGIAHEVKNPLTSLKTFTEYLPKKLDDKEFLLKFSKIIGTEVDRIDDLVHQLLDYGKPAPLYLKTVNITKLLNDTIDIFSNNFLENHIKVIKNYTDKNELLINVDPAQIRQAFMNILLNSIESMDHLKTLSISLTKTANDIIQISFKDTGPGISKPDINRIFDPFFTKKDKGTGLGLSITKTIIDNHNGRIYVNSDGISGSEFTIELPLSS